MMLAQLASDLSHTSESPGAGTRTRSSNPLWKTARTTKPPRTESSVRKTKSVGTTERICPVCQRCFTKSEHLLRHIRCHTKERPFECSMCSKTYSRNDTLLRHERSHSRADGFRGSTSPATSAPQVSIAYGMDDEAPRHNASVPDPVPSDTYPQYMQDQTSVLDPMRSLSGTESVHEQVQGHFLSPLDAVINQIPQQAFSDGQETLSFLPMNHANQSPDQATMNLYEWQSYIPPGNTWMLAEDFDLNALDSALTAPISDWSNHPFVTTSRPPPDLIPSRTFAEPVSYQCPPPPITATDSRTSDVSGIDKHSEDLVHKRWYTQVHSSDSRLRSRAASESPEDPFSVDEQYRDELSRKLRSRVYDDALPSVDYLNLCLQLYFTRFHPTFPIIHVSTFRPVSRKSLLLLSICSIGSVFVGTPYAVTQGVMIFERLNKAILASWETHLSRGRTEALSMVQAALLGQTFGMLSKRPNDRVMVDAFHGTLLAWGRKVVKSKPDDLLLIQRATNDPTVLSDLWNEWALAEQQARLMLALSIHDSELACMFHHEPLVRHNNMRRYPFFANDALFNAPTPQKWMDLLKEQARANSQPTSLDTWMSTDEGSKSIISAAISDSNFTAYSILQSINSSVIEARQSQSLHEVRTQELASGLILWYKTYNKHHHLQKADHLHLRVLWHSIFMSLYADFNLLECGIGRDGYQGTLDSQEELRKWGASLNPLRCVCHALLLQEQVEGMRMGAEPSLHIPRALFYAGVLWICCFRFVASYENWRGDLHAMGLEELALRDVSSPQRLLEASGIMTGLLPGKGQSVIYTLADLLQKIGRWGLSGNFANILVAAVRGCDDA